MKGTATRRYAPSLSRPATRPLALGTTLFLPLLIGLATLLPRVIGLRDFFTTDEAHHWVRLTGRFAEAISTGQWAETILTGHPGVTLWWLGSVGLHLERLATAAGWAAPPDALGHLVWLRLGPALAHTPLLIAAYLLLRRLVQPGLALAAALLWATSPFMVAHGRLLHLDALLTDLCLLAVLATLVAVQAARPLPWLLLSGLFCGLALLTKSPALIVLPFVGLALFVLGGARTGAPEGWRGRLLHGIAWSAPRYLLVLAVAAAVTLALWPALWVAPGQALERYLDEIISNGGRPNGDGQFFLGSPDPDPGPLFYPVVVLFRVTPLELAGLIGVGAGFILIARHGGSSKDPLIARERTTLLALAAFALLWTLVMTAGPKKFDRYILPAWPALLTLSAAGLLAIWHRLRARFPRRWFAGPAAGIAGLLSLQGALLAWCHPYYLSYYNPLLGGGPVAQRTFLIGWGEGMDQVGAWLRTRYDIGEGQIISALPATLQPFVPVPVQEVQAIDRASANYAVVYLESLQRRDAPDIYARITGASLPLHVVTIHGIEYAWIYQLPKPYQTAVEAEFGRAVRLRGYTATLEGRRLTLTPSWDVRAPLNADLLVFVHVYDAAGMRVAGIDVPPGGASAPPTSAWQPGQQVAVPLPIDLPAALPAGVYRLTIGLYDPETFARLPLTGGPAADVAMAGPDAALLGNFLVQP
ncbi:MAG: glycosyltransferase family 39 protein [Oscillochloridaceae bacterium]|nr:glycosyltransferase family 39 protein [Chloroflexaceae bacterium]MDW8388922.1 glycosyltransferase family 39 protein [Oscillochloridaceae bacterium]